MSTAVARVDSVTQTNAAQSEELFATARQLLAKSNELDLIVSSFTIADGRQDAGVTAIPAVPSSAVFAPAFSESTL